MKIKFFISRSAMFIFLIALSSKAFCAGQLPQTRTGSNLNLEQMRGFLDWINIQSNEESFNNKTLLAYKITSGNDITKKRNEILQNLKDLKGKIFKQDNLNSLFQGLYAISNAFGKQDLYGSDANARELKTIVVHELITDYLRKTLSLPNFKTPQDVNILINFYNIFLKHNQGQHLTKQNNEYKDVLKTIVHSQSIDEYWINAMDVLQRELSNNDAFQQELEMRNSRTQNRDQGDYYPRSQISVDQQQQRPAQRRSSPAVRNIDQATQAKPRVAAMSEYLNNLVNIDLTSKSNQTKLIADFASIYDVKQSRVYDNLLNSNIENYLKSVKQNLPDAKSLMSQGFDKKDETKTIVEINAFMNNYYKTVADVLLKYHCIYADTIAGNKLINPLQKIQSRTKAMLLSIDRLLDLFLEESDNQALLSFFIQNNDPRLLNTANERMNDLTNNYIDQAFDLKQKIENLEKEISKQISQGEEYEQVRKLYLGLRNQHYYNAVESILSKYFDLCKQSAQQAETQNRTMQRG